eukprot:m.115307 g.115307  ORF g.115307 m.115307 type:complete len:516 (-) comp10875_c0_seq3:58-1605(-)
MEVYVLESIEDGALVKAPTELGRALSRGGVAVMSTMGVAVWSLVAIAGSVTGSVLTRGGCKCKESWSPVAYLKKDFRYSQAMACQDITPETVQGCGMVLPCNDDGCSATYPTWCEIQPGCTPNPLPYDSVDAEWDPYGGNYDYCNPNASSSTTVPHNQTAVLPCTQDKGQAADGSTHQDHPGGGYDTMTMMVDLWGPLDAVSELQFRVAIPILVEFDITALAPSTQQGILAAIQAALELEGVVARAIALNTTTDHPNRVAISIKSTQWSRCLAVFSGTGINVQYLHVGLSVSVPPGMYIVTAPPHATHAPTSHPTTAAPTTPPVVAGTNDADSRDGDAPGGVWATHTDANTAQMVGLGMGMFVGVLSVTLLASWLKHKGKQDVDANPMIQVDDVDSDPGDVDACTECDSDMGSSASTVMLHGVRYAKDAAIRFGQTPHAIVPTPGESSTDGPSRLYHRKSKLDASRRTFGDGGEAASGGWGGAVHLRQSLGDGNSMDWDPYELMAPEEMAALATD